MAAPRASTWSVVTRQSRREGGSPPSPDHVTKSQDSGLFEEARNSCESGYDSSLRELSRRGHPAAALGLEAPATLVAAEGLAKKTRPSESGEILLLVAVGISG